MVFYLFISCGTIDKRIDTRKKNTKIKQSLN
jgi:hypothetical protein